MTQPGASTADSLLAGELSTVGPGRGRSQPDLGLSRVWAAAPNEHRSRSPGPGSEAASLRRTQRRALSVWGVRSLLAGAPHGSVLSRAAYAKPRGMAARLRTAPCWVSGGLIPFQSLLGAERGGRCRPPVTSRARTHGLSFHPHLCPAPSLDLRERPRLPAFCISCPCCGSSTPPPAPHYELEGMRAPPEMIRCHFRFFTDKF